MKYLRLYNFIADAIRILAIQEEEVYKKYKALSVSKKKEINQKLAGLFPELYDKMQNRLVIIDHHRRGEDFPENPLLVYIEPYASSTCELITEMFEFCLKRKFVLLQTHLRFISNALAFF